MTYYPRKSCFSVIASVGEEQDIASTLMDMESTGAAGDGSCKTGHDPSGTSTFIPGPIVGGNAIEVTETSGSNDSVERISARANAATTRNADLVFATNDGTTHSNRFAVRLVGLDGLIPDPDTAASGNLVVRDLQGTNGLDTTGVNLLYFVKAGRGQGTRLVVRAPVRQTAVFVNTTITAVTITPAQLYGGIIENNAAAVTMTFPTFAELATTEATALTSVETGMTLQFLISNRAGSGIVTVAAGTDGTYNGGTIAVGASKLFLLRFNSATTYVLY